MSQKLYIEIKNYILSLIKENTDGKNISLPSENMLCKKFNASRYSVRHALQVLEEKKQIVRIQGKGTFINTDINKFQVIANEHAIDIIVPFLHSKHASEIILGAQKFCSDYGYTLNIKTTNGEQRKESQYLNTVHYNCQGIILFPCDATLTSKQLLSISASNFPLVLIDRFIPNLNFSCVQTDNSKMLYNAVEELYKKGYKSLCYLTIANDLVSSVTDRNLGFYSGMLNFYNKIEKHNFITCQTYSDDISKILIPYLKNKLIDCIIMNDGPFSLKFINLCNKLNLKIGNDISLILIDDETAVTSMDFNYGKITQKSFEIGYKSAELLHKIIHKKTNHSIIKLNAINDF